MSLRFYADDSARRTRQLVADALLALWCLLAVWAGVVVHGRVLVAEDGATKLETGSGSLAQNMTDAASAVAKIPFVGQEVRTPFDNAATTGRNLSASGHDLADLRPGVHGNGDGVQHGTVDQVVKPQHLLAAAGQPASPVERHIRREALMQDGLQYRSNVVGAGGFQS